MAETPARERGVGMAFARYTALRVAVFAVCLAVAVAVVLPVTGSGELGSRLIVCALVAAVVSVPLSLWLGRGMRAEVSDALARSTQQRAVERRDYDARIRAVRGKPAATTDDAADDRAGS